MTTRSPRSVPLEPEGVASPAASSDSRRDVRAGTGGEAGGQISVHRLLDGVGAPSRNRTRRHRGRVRLRSRSVDILIAQLAALGSGGIALPAALALIATETDDPALRHLTADVAGRLRDGQTLAGALDAQGELIPAHVRGVLGSAEVSGDLGAAIDGLRHHLERQRALRRRLVSALAYPGIVAMMCLASILLLAVVALPRFAMLFADLGVDAPWPVRWSDRMTRSMTNRWPVVLVATSAVSGTLVTLLCSSRWRDRRQTLVVRLPIVGAIQRRSLTERACRTLALLVDAGVGLPEALMTTARASHHAWIAPRLEAAHDRIVAGDDVVDALAATGLFSPTLRQILVVGERIGRLGPQFEAAADLLGADLDRRLHRIGTLAEPVLVVLVGLMVAGVAISLVSSIYGVVGELR